MKTIAVHVIPLFDTMHHDCLVGCGCHPRLGADGVVTHNANDCREAKERAGNPDKPWQIFKAVLDDPPIQQERIART